MNTEWAQSEIERCTLCRGTAAEANVLWDCLPVPCFGNPDHSRVRVATISLNPSSLEFYRPDDRKKDKSERLPMVDDFGVEDRKKLTDEGLHRARQVRDHYFANKPHAWFTPMQMMLRGMNLGWSYAEGTAVQLDVIACATKPNYGKVPGPARNDMIENCRPHLQKTLSRFNCGTMLVVNGSGAFEALGKAVELQPNGFTQRLPSQTQTTVYVGTATVAEMRFRYFGWSPYLHRNPMSVAGAIIDYWNRLPAMW
jgi:hypothetical protein